MLRKPCLLAVWMLSLLVIGGCDLSSSDPAVDSGSEQPSVVVGNDEIAVLPTKQTQAKLAEGDRILDPNQDGWSTEAFSGFIIANKIRGVS